MTLVEFALVSPTVFLLLLGALVLGVVVSSQVSLSNGARDVARALAICGSDANYAARTSSSTTTALPNGSLCTVSGMSSYVNSRLPQVAGCSSTSCFSVEVDYGGSSAQAGTPVTSTLTGVSNPGTDGQTAALCAASGTNAPYTVTIKATYAQNLYVPILGNFFGDNGTTSRTISAQASATCEQ